jgi:cell division septation protein DedD
MSAIDCATDTGLTDSHDPAAGHADNATSKSLKGLFIGFAATVTVGLALASWYVGVRIVGPEETAPPSAPLAASEPAQRPPVNRPVAVIENSTTKVIPAPAPPTPDLYLQVAGLGPKQDAGFVKALEAKGFHAGIQAGELAGDRAIAIGPFSTRAALEQARRKLQSAGVLAIEAAR